jgi:hypothetical protein
MTFRTTPTGKRVALAALGVVALTVTGCANGSGLPTGPSATTAPSGITAAASGEATSTTTSFPRSGALRVEKECSEFNGTNGTFCTITSSNLAAIEVGSKVVYATVNGFGDLDSNVVLDLPGPGNNAAFGHCTLNASVSRCTFSGGTGKFTHFSARVAVSYLGGPNYRWDGTYSFSPQD